MDLDHSMDTDLIITKKSQSFTSQAPAAKSELLAHKNRLITMLSKEGNTNKSDQIQDIKQLIEL